MNQAISSNRRAACCIITPTLYVSAEASIVSNLHPSPCLSSETKCTEEERENVIN